MSKIRYLVNIDFIYDWYIVKDILKCLLNIKNYALQNMDYIYRSTFFTDISGQGTDVSGWSTDFSCTDNRSTDISGQ